MDREKKDSHPLGVGESILIGTIVVVIVLIKSGRSPPVYFPHKHIPALGILEIYQSREKDRKDRMDWDFLGNGKLKKLLFSPFSGKWRKSPQNGFSPSL